MHQIITKNYKDAVSSKFTNNSRYNNHLPWVTETLKGLIKQKNKLYIKTKKSDLDADKQAYKQCKKMVNREMKFARRQYYNKALAENKDNLSKYWSIMKEIIGKGRAEENPSYFLDESGERNEDCMEIATNFNKYFINVGPQLASKTPETFEDCTRYLQHRNDYTIFLEPVIIEETRRIIMALRDAIAGWDCINKLMLINTLDCIVVPLTHILNLSITQGIFPSKLKVAKIKPIYKAEGKHMYTHKHIGRKGMARRGESGGHIKTCIMLMSTPVPVQHLTRHYLVKVWLVSLQHLTRHYLVKVWLANIFNT